MQMLPAKSAREPFLWRGGEEAASRLAKRHVLVLNLSFCWKEVVQKHEKGGTFQRIPAFICRFNCQNYFLNLSSKSFSISMSIDGCPITLFWIICWFNPGIADLVIVLFDSTGTYMTSINPLLALIDLNSATLWFNFIYKFLSNKKLLRILPCQIFHLS